MRGACRCPFLPPDFPRLSSQQAASAPTCQEQEADPYRRPGGPYRGRGLGGRRRTAAQATMALALRLAGGGTRPAAQPACSPARRSVPSPCARTTHGPAPRAVWAAGGSTADRQQATDYGCYKRENFFCFVNNNCNWSILVTF